MLRRHQKLTTVRTPRPRFGVKTRAGAKARRQLHAEALETRNLLAVFTVTNGFDGSPGDLRSAVLAANTTPGPDMIRFQVNAIQLALGEILVTDAVQIDGGTAPLGHVNITAAPGSRIFTVDDGTPVPQVVSLNELTLSGGNPGTFASGGAVLNKEDLTILNSTITGNTAAAGGGIFSGSARLALRNSAVYVNYASYEGGGIMNVDGLLEVHDSTIQGNRVANNNGSWTFGGGIRNLGRATSILDNSQVLGNAAYASGGARAHGGGIATMLESTVHLIHSIVGDNYASHEGGGLFVVDNSTMIVELQSSVFGNIAGEAGGGIYLLRCTADVQDSTITNNVTEFRGGGISAGNDVVLNVVNSDISTNTTNFFSPDGSGGGAYLSGFGQANGPTVTISDSRIHGNNVDPSGSAGGEFGGGISARYGTRLDVHTSEITGNLASISGGGLYGSDRFTPYAPDVTIHDSLVQGNSSGSLGGGLTVAGGHLELRGSTVAQNTAQDRGGGLFLTGLGSLQSLQVEVQQSTISGNSADVEGGGVAAGPHMTLTIDESQVISNRTLGKGAGLYLTALGLPASPHVATISASTIKDNVARYVPANPTYASGAGIWAGPAANLSVDSSTITGNRAGRHGGGMMMVDAVFSVQNSTLDNNLAGMDGGGAYLRNSDGLFEQDTWSQNRAAENGGALHLFSAIPKQAFIHFNTFSLNQADHDVNGTGRGGGIFIDDQPLNAVQTHVANSIVADNFAGNILLTHNDDLHDGPGLAGLPPVVANHSLIGSRKGTLLVAAHPDVNGNIVGTAILPISPMLATLANYGGPTQTMLPQTASPAIDAGDPFFVAPPTFDQRGNPFARVIGARVDMGSVEWQPTLPGPDLDGDGDADCDDIDALTTAIASSTYISAFDMNGDGILSLTDVERWLCKAGSLNLGPGLSYRFGDANLDGNVDGGDFIIWNSNKFAVNSRWCSADFNADGTVDGLDFITWNANKFLGPTPCNPAPIVHGGGQAQTDSTVFDACSSVPSVDRPAAQTSTWVRPKDFDTGEPSVQVAPPFDPPKQDRDNKPMPHEKHRLLDLVFADLS